MKNEYMNLDISNIDYNELKSALKAEVFEKLQISKPKTVFAASRISGISQAALSIVVHFKKRKLMKDKTSTSACNKNCEFTNK